MVSRSYKRAEVEDECSLLVSLLAPAVSSWAFSVTKLAASLTVCIVNVLSEGGSAVCGRKRVKSDPESWMRTLDGDPDEASTPLVPRLRLRSPS